MAGHIHIGADYLKTKNAYKNLIELWSNNEELLYLISNKKGDIFREGAIEYATPISKKIKDAVENKQFDDYSNFTKDDIIEKIKDIQVERGLGINFKNIESVKHINTIEFRLSNGTIDADTWIENATLFGGIVETAQRISDIREKENLTEEEKGTLEKFELLKTKEITEEKRVDTFLDLCVPENFKQVFRERYLENSKLILQENVRKEKLKKYISDQPISISDDDIKNLANAEGVADKKQEARDILDNLIRNKNISKDTQKGK